jgi:hypothetical protein
MNSVQLAAKLGGKVNGDWINIRGPGHSSDDFSLGVCPNPHAPDGFVVHSLAGDSPSVCRAYVKAKLGGLDLNDDVEISTKQKSSAFVPFLWAEAQPIEGTPAAKYLGLRNCSPATGTPWPADLRSHPTCPFGAFKFPALMGLVRNVVTGEPVGIHRTALSDDGASKRMMPSGLPPRMVLGRASGAAIQLHQASFVLGLAEGIETALSAQKIFKVPVWAALSATGIRSFPVIHGVSRLFVFADNDGPGLAAARRCKRRYRDAGIETQIRHPSEYGTDWNDYLLKG